MAARERISLEQAAELSELSPETLDRYARLSKDGFPQMRRKDRTFSGAAFREWLRRRGPRRPPRRPVVECGTLSGWRVGCRCDQCRDVHNEHNRNYRRERSDLPEQVRAEVLEALAAGMSFTAIDDEIGVPQQWIYSRAALDPEWSVQVDDALMQGRMSGVEHGKESTYRLGCRCGDCREAKRQSR